ncbi:MAG: hypothetical protein IPN90_08845 [Elusimicrobia bacterium]|nr:hypothetical protein [Elusimicrobiota bacterium]
MENGLPQVDLRAQGTIGFAQEILTTHFEKVRNMLIAQGKPEGKPYFPYLYESRDREFIIESDGIKIVLVDVAERAAYDPSRPLSEFTPPPRDIREAHPAEKCLFCRLLNNNSPEFFASIHGTGENVYRMAINLGEYGFPHFQFIAEDPVPNLYDRDNRFLDFLLSARALGPEFTVLINGAFSGASQQHLHWHGIKRKEGGLWAYVDSLSPPKPGETFVREELESYPGRPILFRGKSPDQLAETIVQEIKDLYDEKTSAGVFARVKLDGNYEVVVAPTRGERVVSWDVIFNGSNDEFDKNRQTLRDFNLSGKINPAFNPLTDGMGATHTPGTVPNVNFEIPEGFRENPEWQTRTAKRLILLFGDYNPTHGREPDPDTFNAPPKQSSTHERTRGSSPLAQTSLTKSVWKFVARLFRISPDSPSFRQKELTFTVFWEFFLHWMMPFFLVSWMLARFGVSLPDMWLIPILAVILEPVFVGSHSISDQGKELSWLAHFLMAFYGFGGFLMVWGGWGIVFGVAMVAVGLRIHYLHDMSRASPPPSPLGQGQSQNDTSKVLTGEIDLRAILDLPKPVDAELRSATARFRFVGALGETAVRDRSAVTSKNFLLSLMDAYAKAGDGWSGDLGQVVKEENAGVWVVPVGADRKGAGALARACLASRGRDTEIRFVAENEAVAFALSLWSFGRSRVQVRTVPGAFSLGSGDRRVVRLLVVQEALAKDVALRPGMAWRIVAPESIAMDYSGLSENSPLWSASVVFIDALLRSLPVSVGRLRDLDSVASRLIKRMA